MEPRLICPSAIPAKKEAGGIYCKHDAIFTLITEGDCDGDEYSRYDDHLTERGGVSLLIKNKKCMSDK